MTSQQHRLQAGSPSDSDVCNVLTRDCILEEVIFFQQGQKLHTSHSKALKPATTTLCAKSNVMNH